MTDIGAVPSVIAEAIEAGIPATKAFRIYKNRSIPEIAEAASLDPSRLCLIEAGVTPTAREVNLLTEILEIPDRFFAGRA